MRKAIIQQIIKNDNEDTYFLTADVGFGILEPLEEKMGNRFINVGISEQSMISIASGLALSKKIVYTYTMCAFYLRAIEQIRNDLCYQDVPVTMIGVGTGFDYGHLGSTHFAHEDADIIGRLPNIDVYTPNDIKEAKELIKKRNIKPRYIRIGYDHSIIKLEELPKEGGSSDYFLKKYYANR